MKIRPQIIRILRDIKSDDDDISTYAAMSVLRLKEVNEGEIAKLLPALRTSTTSSSISVRFFSKKALNEIKLQMARYPTFRQEFDKLKQETKKSSWHNLLTNLEQEETDNKLVVLDYLRDVDDPLLPNALMEFIDEEKDPFVLAEAIKVLGIIGNKDGVDFLEKYLSHADSRIRSNAVEAMVEIGGKEVMRSILPLLEDDDNRVKATVAKICSQHGETQVMSTLASMLHSVEIWMRESATYALGYVPCGESVDLLLEAVCDVNPEIQRKAIEALGNLQAKRAREFLNSLVGSADPAIVASAQEALAKIGRDPKTYSYFELRYEEGQDPLEILAKRRRGKGGQSASGGSGADDGEASLASKAMKLVSSDASEIEETLAAMLTERGNLCEDVGTRALELYREGELKHSYLAEYSNEVKKLLYLIEQKESQKKDIKEETEKTTFLSFIKESVSRFTQEKQVDSRMESLKNQLKDTHRRLGDRLIKDSSVELDSILFNDIPNKIAKLDRQVVTLQKSLAASD